MRKKRITLLLIAALTLLCLPALCLHAEETSGSCGENVTWEVKGDVLTISGAGAMSDYEEFNRCPWADWSISRVVIENGVTSVGAYAFACMNELKTAEIAGSVRRIGFSAFAFCGQLENVLIGDGAETICDSAFFRCENLRAVTLPESVTNIEMRAFDQTGIFLNRANWENDRALYIGRHLYRVSGNTATPLVSGLKPVQGAFTVKAGTRSLAGGAFAMCLELTRVDLPEGLHTIESYCFVYCSALKKVNLPSTLRSLNEHAFANCTALCELAIPRGVNEIGEYAFTNCNLQRILIPRSAHLCATAFAGASVKELYYGGTEEELAAFGLMRFNKDTDGAERFVSPAEKTVYNYAASAFPAAATPTPASNVTPVPDATLTAGPTVSPAAREETAVTETDGTETDGTETDGTTAPDDGVPADGALMENNENENNALSPLPFIAGGAALTAGGASILIIHKYVRKRRREE